MADTTAARTRLAEQEERLLRALACGDPVPAGFDEASVRRAAVMLAEKRWRNLERTLPALVHALGPGGPPHFVAHALDHPSLGRASPEADALLFASLALRGTALPQAARRELAAAARRFRIRDGRVVARRRHFRKITS